VVFDTDVLIWYTRGHSGAAQEIDRAESRCIALPTALEFLQGSTSLSVLHSRRSFIRDMDFEVLPLSANIGHRALVYIEAYAMAHGLRAGDSLIAATAVEQDMPLCTANAKRFRAIHELKLKVLKA
jgi:predicted nucleic acid-binding protein